MLIFLLGACSIVNSYSNQLREEEVKDSENW